MSKAAEKADTRWAHYRSAGTMLGRLMAAYSDGKSLDGQPVDAERISNEIVAMFRAHGCCFDHSGVSYDGPMCELIYQAMKAAEQNGAKVAVVITSNEVM